MDKTKETFLKLKKAFIFIIVFDAINLLLNIRNSSSELVSDALKNENELFSTIFFAIVAGMIALAIFRILAKVFLIKRGIAECENPSSRNGHIVLAQIMLIFSIIAVVSYGLVFGDEGTTIGYNVHAAAGFLVRLFEAVTMYFYIRAAKEIKAKV